MCHPLFGRRRITAVSVCMALSVLTTVYGDEARRITYVGYPDCIELSNATTRVVLCPVGGRVLEYSLRGKNALYLEEAL